MTNFETVGIERQYGATTMRRAKRELEKSCDMCGRRGRQTRCDRCVIAIAHNDIICILK